MEAMAMRRLTRDHGEGGDPDGDQEQSKSSQTQDGGQLKEDDAPLHIGEGELLPHVPSMGGGSEWKQPIVLPCLSWRKRRSEQRREGRPEATSAKDIPPAHSTR
jgi:hypothetical protein